jgi:hypothetical protein
MRILEDWDGLPESAVTPIADVLLHGSETTRCANSRPAASWMAGSGPVKEQVCE